MISVKEAEDYSGRFFGSINQPAADTIAPPTMVAPAPADAPLGDPPTISALTPATGVSGADTAVTVDGTGFYDDSVVQFDGVDASTVYGSGTQLMFDAPSGIHTAGDFPVTVRNADGQTSAAMTFTVTAP